MNPNTKKRVLAAVLSLLIALAAVPSAFAVTGTVEYSPSASYAGGEYYAALKSVKLTGDQLIDIVNVAKSQIGYHESYSSYDLSGDADGEGDFTEYGRWYGYQGAWCNMFATWCAGVAGISTSIVPRLVSAESAYYSAFSSVGAERFEFGDRPLQPGDFVFSCTCSCSYGCIDHVAIVTDVDDSYIYTVDGNFSNCVKQLKYPVSSGCSYYYGSRINYVARPQYINNSATPEDVKEAAFIKAVGNSVYEVYDYSIALDDAKRLCESFGGSLAGLNGSEDTLKSVISNGKYDRYYVLSDESEKLLYTDGFVVNAPQRVRATGFVCEYSLDSVTPVNTASFGGNKYEVYDCHKTFDAIRCIAELKGAKILSADEENLSLISLLFKESGAYYTADGKTAVLNDGTGNCVDISELEETSLGFVLVYGEEEKATLTYELGGGTKTPNEQISKKGTSVSVSDIIPENGDSEFLGWSLDKKANSAALNPGDTLILDENTVLYAVWG